MKKNCLLFLLAVVAVGSTIAQTDSAYYDLGYTRLSRNFTQSIVIRGGDLEKLPFVNLSDVIGAWTYGAYSNRGTLSYVVDGIPVGDVNGYSIYDIEEIVLVQNAGALVNTGGLQQEWVLVRTKRGKGPSGLVVAGQTGLINSDSASRHAGMRWWQDLYAGGYRNWKNWSGGISGNYQRDAWPLPVGTTVTPYNQQRWRLNGYVSFRPDKYNTVEAAVNFVPQRMEYEADSIVQGVKYDGWQKGSRRYWLPRLRWHGEWPGGFSNDLEGRYLSSSYRERDFSGNADTATIDQFKQLTYDSVHGTHLIVREALRYTFRAGGWRIIPAVTGTYEREVYHVGSATIDSTIRSNGFPGYGTSTYQYSGKGHFFIITPSMEIGYRDLFELQWGAESYQQSNLPAGTRREFPFVTAGADLLRIFGAKEGGSHLKLYGSYAERIWGVSRSVNAQQFESLTDLGSVNANYTSGGAVFGGGQVYYFNPYRPDTVKYWVWTLGMGFEGADGRIKANYTFERRNIYAAVVIALPFQGYSIAYPAGPSVLHHFSVEGRVGQGPRWEWRSSLQVTLLRSKLNYSYARIYENGVAGDKDPDPLSWTGGWVNRVSVGRLGLGLDLLWHFGETLVQPGRTGIDTMKRNSVLMPQLFAGYRFGVGHEREMEVFAESRGLIRSSRSDLSDDRRYYTLGAKFGL